MVRKMNITMVRLTGCCLMLVVSIMVGLEIYSSLEIELVTLHRELSQQQPRTITRTDKRLKGDKVKVIQELPTRTTPTPTRTPTRPFPKWGSSVTEEQEIGIPFPPLLSFIQTSSPFKGISSYYRSTLDHSKASKTILPYLPEMLYMIQPSDGNNQTAGTASVPSPPVLYASILHRRQHGPAAPTERWQELELTKKHKLNQTERVMLYALQMLHQEVSTNIAYRQQNDNVCQDSRWPFLCQNLYPSLTLSNTNQIGGGFPFLAYYGDYKGCNHHNWQQLANGDNTEPISWEDLQTNATKNVSIPLFTVAAQSKDCNYTVPFPNFYQISFSLDDNVTRDKRMKRGLPEYSWSQKQSKIVWRGSLTGGIADNVTKCPRWKMVETMYQIEKRRRELHHQNNRSKATTTTTRNIEGVNESTSLPKSSDYQEIFDVKITAIEEPDKIYQSQLEHDIGDQPIVKSRLQLHQMQWYRGVIDIDGHSWSGRFGSLLCMNSVVMKVDPSWVEYFYARRQSGNNDELQAWKHYIPIRADLSNLEEMTEYVLDPANDEVLQEIVLQANSWCRQNMMISRIVTDMLDVWDRYVQLLNINNDRWLEQWNDRVQTSILENPNLLMDVLDISNYPPIPKGQ